MSRRLPTAALLAALVLPCLVGCGSSATTGTGGAATSHAGPPPPGHPAESARDTGHPHDAR